MNDLAMHQKMMESPADWPRWPVLPVKRRSQDPDNPGLPEVGIMTPGSWNVYRMNMLQLQTGSLTEQLRATDAIEYPDVLAVLDDGWRVD